MSTPERTAVLQAVLAQEHVYRANSHLRNGLPGVPQMIQVGEEKLADAPAATAAAAAVETPTVSPVAAVADAAAEAPKVSSPLAKYLAPALIGASAIGLPTAAGLIGYMARGSDAKPASSNVKVDFQNAEKPGLIRKLMDRGANLPGKLDG